MATFTEVRDVTRSEALIKRLARDPDHPKDVDGVRWWVVGENASHTFYLGLDAAGQLWRTAFGDGDDVTCACAWDVFCQCSRLDVGDVMTCKRRLVDPGDQLYLGR